MNLTHVVSSDSDNNSLTMSTDGMQEPVAGLAAAANALSALTGSPVEAREPSAERASPPPSPPGELNEDERNRERNRGYARAYRERKRVKLQTLESMRQEMLKENSRLQDEAQTRTRAVATVSAERDALKDRLSRAEAENTALRNWIQALYTNNRPAATQAAAPPADKSPM